MANSFAMKKIFPITGLMLSIREVDYFKTNRFLQQFICILQEALLFGLLS